MALHLEQIILSNQIHVLIKPIIVTPIKINDAK